MSTRNKIQGFLDRLQVLPSKLRDKDTVGTRKRCEYKETEDSLIIYVDLPGLSKQNVTVSVDKINNIVIVKAEEDKESPIESSRRYERKIKLSKKTYKLELDAIKAEMKNGVLKLVIPKMENSVFHVYVE